MRPHILHNGLHRIGDRLNHFIDSERFLGRNPLEDLWMSRARVPLTNVIKNRKYYDLEVALPGFRKEEISLSVQDRTLTVATRKDETASENTIAQQAVSGPSLRRTFRLPDSVDTEGIRASFEGGILYVRLPYESKKDANIIAVY